MPEHRPKQRPTAGRRPTTAGISARPEAHLTSVLRAVRNVNQLITREKDRHTLLRRACEILTETRGYRSAWIGLGDPAGRMAIAAESGIGEAFAATRADLDHQGWPACARQALGGGEVAVLHDPMANCVQCPLSRSYRDSAALAAALRHEGRDFGVLVVALPRAVADDQDERRLFAEVAGDLGFALHAIELEAEHRAAQAREAHLKQVLLAIRNVNQLIVHEDDPRRLIERACVNLTETLGYHNAWIALLDGDGRAATATARAGFDGQFDAMDERLARGELSACARRALVKDATVVVSDPSAECADCPLSGEYAGRAGSARRLAFGGKTYGILAVSVPATYALDEEEQDLFAELAGDLGFALHKIELRASLQAAENRVHAKLNALLAPEGDLGPMELTDVLDVPAVQRLMDQFFGLTGIGMAILDLEGRVLVATGWQDICTRFHRVHPETRRHCLESDTELSSGVKPGTFKRYRCKNNLWDMATPILLGDRHAGNLFLGQFAFDDEEPDREVFRAQARRYGFDEEAYLAALARIPRWSRERVAQAMTFYTSFAGQLSDLSYGNLRLARSLAQRDELLARLGRSEERLRLALKATRDVVWDWDIVNDAQRWNETGAAVFGWTDIVCAPQTAAWWLDRIHPADRQRVDAVFFAAVNDPVVDRWRDEYRFRTADGAYADVADRGYILRDADGRAVRMIGAMLDITDRKRAQEEREKLQSQLLQAQKMESVGRLAGGVAHDFNNLLMGVMGYADLCREEVGPNHPIVEWLDEITHEAQRSANLTRQLLAFARKQIIEPRVLDLNEAVSGMLKLLRRLIGEDIALAWMPGTSVWPIKCDPGQIDQILANLCVNARDAVAGVGRITVETSTVLVDQAYCAKSAEALPGEYAVLAVSDDGCGMDHETLSHVFEPFFTTKPLGQGTGLGLATVYGIVKQNGGFVTVYSELGKGTTFRVHLPRCQKAAQGMVVAHVPGPRPRGTETIMLVEDEKGIRVTTALFLQVLGYTVLTAEDPAEALHLAKHYSGPIHLLITDVVMPGMNGKDLATKLTEAHPCMKCLFISGYTVNVIVHRGILEKGVHFLAKPFARDALACKVYEVLRGESTTSNE